MVDTCASRWAHGPRAPTWPAVHCVGKWDPPGPSSPTLEPPRRHVVTRGGGWTVGFDFALVGESEPLDLMGLSSVRGGGFWFCFHLWTRMEGSETDGSDCRGAGVGSTFVLLATFILFPYRLCFSFEFFWYRCLR